MNKSLPFYGFGTFHLAKHGFKGRSLDKAIETLAAAFSTGITFFDTAPVYGFGSAETILGDILRPIREKVLIATKCGLIADNGRVRHDLSGDSILRECEASLSRLKSDYIDLYQIHWPDPHTPMNETCKALMRLKEEGLVLNIGVSNFNLQLLQEITNYIPLYSVQNHYSMLFHVDDETVIPWCAENGIHYIAYNVLEQGLFSAEIDQNYKTGKHDLRKLNPLFTNSSTLEEAVHFKQKISDNPLRAALTFASSNTHISSILVSTSSTEHLRDNVRIVEEARLIRR